MNNLLSKLGLVSLKEEEPKADNVSNGNGSGNSSDSDSNGKKETEKVVVFDDQDVCDKYIKSLDPKEWKNQDHYRVLGLSKRRIDATESEIKKACKWRR